MRQFALIGQPVSHSKSPQMHNATYKELGLDAEYVAYDTSELELETIINQMRNNVIEGINITIPHKVAIMKHLDIIDEDALAIGAVNTVVKLGDQLIGRNTDAPGFIESLKRVYYGPSLKEKNALVLGAGGAARAIVYALCKEGVQVTLTNRTSTKADELASSFSNHAISVQSLEESEDLLGHYDIVVNTTSVGMYPVVEQMPINFGELNERTLVCDLIYNPLETVFLQEAKKRGNQVLNGLGMFVNQAAFSIQHWTGLMPDLKSMEETVKRQFK